MAEGQAAEAELRWNAQFGDVYKIKGFMGEDRLHISDPKAVQYIFQSSRYKFPKQLERREASRLVSGRGILWADGDIHKRQRKVLLPGFSTTEAKEYLPVFSRHAVKMVEKWKDIIESGGDATTFVDIPSWASRWALDSIGEVAFDYQFGTLDNSEDALGNAFANLLLNTFGVLTKREILFGNIMIRLPEFLREFISDNISSKKLRYARDAAKLSIAVAQELIKQKLESQSLGKGSRDIMSILVEANKSGDENTRLSEEEMLGVMRVIILAGHETTANTMSWVLLELSRRPDLQMKLRDEIRLTERAFQARGESQYTIADLDSMPYLNAETLRYHPVIISLMRQPAKDDVIPLSKPVTMTTGEVLTELYVRKGTKITTSIGCYNRHEAHPKDRIPRSLTGVDRNKEVFGEDADVFDPERWLDSRVQKTMSVGVIGNLYTVSTFRTTDKKGQWKDDDSMVSRACLGWKFAVVEMQAFLFEVLGRFEILPAQETRAIRRESALVMTPTIEGEVEKGAQLRLGIRAITRNDV
ncbi:hypothetical protein H0H92_002099 [Tricholoma furcatifolium]|nr:hypothetical protein H0H92_002099 [Tricholoma furcatifolium]